MLGSFFPLLQSFIRNEKESYILVENKFSRKRKMDFESFIYYFLGNKGKTTILELDEFFYMKNGDGELSITKQDFSKQRTYIDPLIFKHTIRDTLKNIYSDNEYYLEDFKGYFLFAVDGSQVELPNNKITREEFDVGLRSLKETNTPKARVSVFFDVKNDFIIDSIISSTAIGESKLAFENIEETSKILDFKKSIVIFDRLYASAELFMQLLDKESKFIFRLDKKTYKKERNKMKTDDEWVEIGLNSSRTKSIKNKDLKEKAEKVGFLNLRIVNIELETGEIETLITNLSENIASSAELKELYGERWGIEKGYNVLKNRIHIENFSGHRKIAIEQDFYSQTLMYNMLIDFKLQTIKKIKKKNKKNNLKCEYKPNINILAGKLKNNLYKIIFAETDKERENQVPGRPPCASSE
jgi:hypothetical protein